MNNTEHLNLLHPRNEAHSVCTAPNKINIQKTVSVLKTSSISLG